MIAAPKLSVFIIAKNEEDRIPVAIRSVKDIADEIIVIDSGSGDNTVKVAEEMGARVIFNEWQGYGMQKIFGQNACKNSWILNIDADEEITPKLAREISELLEKNPKMAAYELCFKEVFVGYAKPNIFSPSYKVVRLYNKNLVGFKSSSIHDSVDLSGIGANSIGVLRNYFIHRPFRNLTHQIDKINSYSSMQARDMYDKKRNPAAIRIIFEPILAFLKAFIIRRNFIYGLDGFIQSCIYAYSRILRLAKARELFKKDARLQTTKQ